MSKWLQQQARALGDPTRYAIFQHVGSAVGPVRVAALSREFGLHHNAVRQHLAKLCEAELVVEERAARAGPGRPALEYRLAPGVPGTWGAQGPYKELAILLLEMVASGRAAIEVGRAAGVLAAATASETTLDDRLSSEMRRRGFEPRVVAKGEIVLRLCPFVTAATAQPDVVCEIHRGVIEGFVESSGLAAQLTARPPQDGGCRIQLG